MTDENVELEEEEEEEVEVVEAGMTGSGMAGMPSLWTNGVAASGAGGTVPNTLATNSLVMDREKSER